MSALRVLIVDDDRELADNLAVLLRLWGHVARPIYDDEAIEVAREFVPDVFLIDIGMPLEGCTLARIIRQQPVHRDALLIAITGFRDENHRKFAEASGFLHYLVKPLDLSLLRDILEVRALRSSPSAEG